MKKFYLFLLLFVPSQCFALNWGSGDNWTTPSFQGASRSSSPVAAAAGGGGGGGDILVGHDASTTTTAAVNADTWWHTWDGDFNGSGNDPYTAVKTGTVAKAYLALGTDASPAANAKVCVYNASEVLLGCCSGAIPDGTEQLLELSTCDSISITNTNGYFLAFAFDTVTQTIGTTADTWKLANDADDLDYDVPPDPLDHVGGVNAGYPKVYVTD